MRAPGACRGTTDEHDAVPLAGVGVRGSVTPRRTRSPQRSRSAPLARNLRPVTTSSSPPRRVRRDVAGAGGRNLRLRHGEARPISPASSGASQRCCCDGVAKGSRSSIPGIEGGATVGLRERAGLQPMVSANGCTPDRSGPRGGDCQRPGIGSTGRVSWACELSSSLTGGSNRNGSSDEASCSSNTTSPESTRVPGSRSAGPGVRLSGPTASCPPSHSK